MIEIRTDQHIFGTGMTGSGKTVLFTSLFRGIPSGHGVVIDVKHELELGGVICRTPYDVQNALNENFNAVYRGGFWDGEADEIAHIVYKRGNCVLWVDEAAEIIPEGNCSKEFKLLFTAGRSRRATAWTLCQRPALVTKTAISQSSHTFVFYLNQSHDKKAIQANIPLSEEQIESLQKYYYWHYEQGMQQAQLCKPVSI